MQQVCAWAMHMWGALAIFSLTVKLFLFPWFPITCKTQMHEQGEEEKQTKKSIKPPRHQEHSLSHSSGEIHNLSWPLEVFRLEWNAKAERTLQSFTAAWLQLLLCTFLSSVSHLTLPHSQLCRSTIFLHLELQKMLQVQILRFYLRPCHEQHSVHHMSSNTLLKSAYCKELKGFLLCFPSKKWSFSFIFADIPEETTSSKFCWWSQVPSTSGVPAIV